VQASFQPPDIAKFQIILKAMNYYFEPTFIGLENLDLNHRPALFVGNHTIYGLLDIPLLINEIYQRYGVYIRSLGDHAHFLLPGWHQLLSAGGMVDGTPENCAALMAQGESILVFPGGSREVMRRKGDDYQLFWKQRTGFVRMAIEHGYDIIPFASVGPNECFDIHFDAEDVIQKKWVQKIIKKLSMDSLIRQGDSILPLSYGMLGLPVPKPQKFYFSFGARQSSDKYTLDFCSQMLARDKVKNTVEQQITELKQLRNSDRDASWSWIRKKLTN
jgi:1-acyl-sn-glycerol-3-phosphate acyltransferase